MVQRKSNVRKNVLHKTVLASRSNFEQIEQRTDVRKILVIFSHKLNHTRWMSAWMNLCMGFYFEILRYVTIGSATFFGWQVLYLTRESILHALLHIVNWVPSQKVEEKADTAGTAAKLGAAWHNKLIGVGRLVRSMLWWLMWIFGMYQFPQNGDASRTRNCSKKYQPTRRCVSLTSHANENRHKNQSLFIFMKIDRFHSFIALVQFFICFKGWICAKLWADEIGSMKRSIVTIKQSIAKIGSQLVYGFMNSSMSKNYPQLCWLCLRTLTKLKIDLLFYWNFYIEFVFEK